MLSRFLQSPTQKLSHRRRRGEHTRRRPPAMDTGGDPNAANLTPRPRRRNRRIARLATSRRRGYLPAMDDAADPDAADGHPATAQPTREWLSLDEQMSGRRRDEPYRQFPMPAPIYLGGRFSGCVITSRSEHLRACELARRRRQATRSQASSSAAPPSDHPEAERTGSGTRVRQSVLYSDRPRQSRRRRPTEHVEHHNTVSSSELELTNPLTFEALSASGSAGFHSNHSEVERTRSGTLIRQSVLYSDRPRRPRHRRPTEHVEHPGDLEVPNLPAFEAPSVRDSTEFLSATEEHPSEVRSSKLCRAVTDLPALEALSLMNELPLLNPDETSEDSSDDDVVDEHHSEAPSTLRNLSSIETVSPSDTQAPLEESDYEYDELPGVGACGQTLLFFNQPKGISRSMVLADSLFVTVSDDDKEQPKPDSDVESNESESEMEESSRPCFTFREFFDRISAIEQATLGARAAERGTELPSAVITRAAAEAQRQQETRSLQAPQQDSAAAILRHEASTEDIVRKGKKWMCEEVMLCFKKCIERRPDLVGLEYRLYELCCQCFNVDSYNKVFHHYNFRVMMKMPSSVNWTVELYFAEVKQIFGRKYYFCCALEQDEEGVCYACKNQGVGKLKHPATGGFDMGSPDGQCSLW